MLKGQKLKMENFDNCMSEFPRRLERIKDLVLNTKSVRKGRWKPWREEKPRQSSSARSISGDGVKACDCHRNDKEKDWCLSYQFAMWFLKKKTPEQSHSHRNVFIKSDLKRMQQTNKRKVTTALTENMSCTLHAYTCTSSDKLRIIRFRSIVFLLLCGLYFFIDFG